MYSPIGARGETALKYADAIASAMTTPARDYSKQSFLWIFLLVLEL
jgi:hypothetical protein